jgi:hypothetical protein
MLVLVDGRQSVVVHQLSCSEPDSAYVPLHGDPADCFDLSTDEDMFFSHCLLLHLDSRFGTAFDLKNAA